jgi:hypothetical protein
MMLKLKPFSIYSLQSGMKNNSYEATVYKEDATVCIMDISYDRKLKYKTFTYEFRAHEWLSRFYIATRTMSITYQYCIDFP